MIAIVLAGGFGKRLWPHTLNKAKVLLPVAGKPVIDYVINKVQEVPSISRILVSTNLRFQSQFQEWLHSRHYEKVELVPDPSTSENEKIGAVQAMFNVASTINDDFMVIAGDNIFTDNLNPLVELFGEKRTPVIALYHAKKLEDVKRGASVTVSSNGRILEFAEKPEAPSSDMVGACIYIFPKRIKKRMFEYLQVNPLHDDAGRFIEWLHKVEPVYGLVFKDYIWDIGTRASYDKAINFFNGSMQ
jgi:glucose-1-phosphate thymidylyltransferase